MNEVTFSIELVNVLFNYLATKPYAEVSQLIAEIQKQAAAQAQKNGETVSE